MYINIHIYTFTEVGIKKKGERESTDYEKLSIVVWYEGIAIKCNLWMNKKRRIRKIVLRNSLFFTENNHHHRNNLNVIR